MATKATTPGPLLRLGSRDYWLEAARKARAMATQLGDRENHALALAIASSYDLLAKHSEPAPRGAHVASLLREADDHIAQGERHIARQQALLVELARDHHDIRQAEALLRNFEETQKLHVEHRDRLHREADAVVPRETAPGLRPRRTRRNNPR